VAVIGGGLIGCASAWYLARAGARVVLLEAGQLNAGASGRNAGSLHFQIEHRHLVHGEQLDGNLEYLVRLSHFAIEQWRELGGLLEQDLEIVMDGGLMVAETLEEVEVLRHKAKVERLHGLATELLGGDEVRRLAPYISKRVLAAAFCAQEGHCNPRLVTAAFARRGAEAGAVLLTDARVDGVAFKRGEWQVTWSSRQGSGREQIRAAAVLNAGGAWAGEIAQMAHFHLPVFPVGLLMNVTERIGASIGYLIQHVGRRLSLKQVRDGNILIGGGWPVCMRRRRMGLARQWQPGTPAPSTVIANLRTAAQLVPSIGDLHLLRTWSGVTAVTSDHLPVVGEIPGSHGLFVAGGGSGFTFGPTYARLISQLILTGSSSISLAPFSPERCETINMFMRTG